MSLFYLSSVYSTEEIEFIQRIRKKKKKRKKRCFRCTNYKYSLKIFPSFLFFFSFFKRFKLQRVPRELHLSAMSFFSSFFFLSRSRRSKRFCTADRSWFVVFERFDGFDRRNVWRIDPRKRGKKIQFCRTRALFREHCCARAIWKSVDEFCTGMNIGCESGHRAS